MTCTPGVMQRRHARCASQQREVTFSRAALGCALLQPSGALAVRHLASLPPCACSQRSCVPSCDERVVLSRLRCGAVVWLGGSGRRLCVLAGGAAVEARLARQRRVGGALPRLRRLASLLSLTDSAVRRRLAAAAGAHAAHGAQPHATGSGAATGAACHVSSGKQRPLAQGVAPRRARHLQEERTCQSTRSPCAAGGEMVSGVLRCALDLRVGPAEGARGADTRCVLPCCASRAALAALRGVRRRCTRAACCSCADT
jgi:hypothetical protein